MGRCACNRHSPESHDRRGFQEVCFWKVLKYWVWGRCFLYISWVFLSAIISSRWRMASITSGLSLCSSGVSISCLRKLSISSRGANGDGRSINTNPLIWFWLPGLFQILPHDALFQLKAMPYTFPVTFVEYMAFWKEFYSCLACCCPMALENSFANSS